MDAAATEGETAEEAQETNFQRDLIADFITRRTPATGSESTLQAVINCSHSTAVPWINAALGT